MAAGDEFGVEGYVLGLPLNMDGSAGSQAQITRAFGARLAKLSGLPVTEWDERLSSKAADVHLSEFDLTHKKRKSRRDALAAQIILQGYLDHGAEPGAGGRPDVDVGGGQEPPQP